MKITMYSLRTLLIFFMIVVFVSCSGKKENNEPIKITISVKDVIVVNADTVAIDSLTATLKELGVTKSTDIRIVPDPEAGQGTIDQVQRTVRIFQSSD